MKRNKIYAWMAVALTLAACSTNDIADITANDADNIVNIASVTRSGEGGTATSTMTAPFHLVNVTQQTNYGWKCEADYTYNSSTGQYARKDGDLVVWCNIKSDNSSERMVANEFQAFSPLRTVANEASYTTFQILPDQSTADKLAAADWMTATATSTKAAASDGLSLNFEHRNAKLHFNVTVKDDVAALTVNDDAAALTSNNFKVLGAITPYYNSTGNSKTIEAIVKPKDYSESGTNLIELSINIDENTSETLAVPFPSGLSTLSPGKQYNFNLVIGHNAATISSVSVTDWSDSDISVGWNDEALFLTSYVTFTSDDEVGFKMTTHNYTISGLEYSVNNGEWKPIPPNGISDGVPFGGTKGKLRLRGKNPNGTATGMFNYAKIFFTSNDENAKVACTGDIRTLLDWENNKTVDTSNACFCCLFENCTLLTSAPDLPATALKSRCYYYIFSGCSSLTKAPELPATTLADGCYENMFYNCTQLTSAPELPATTLAGDCYSCMFECCTSLTTAPALPAETLADYCYDTMFKGCTSLTTAPALPAETLADNCYSNMFNGCIKLQSVTMLATDVIASDCLFDWLYDAGTDATSRTLTVASQDAYNTIVNTKFYDYVSVSDIPALPEIWKIGAPNTTVKDKNGNILTSSSSTAP